MSIDWAEVYNIKPIYYEKCWEESNSYCCMTNSPHLDFRLMKKDSAGMIYIHSEWEYCKNKGRLKEGFEESAKEINFEISPGRIIRLITTYCSLKGQCTYPEFRPLICRFYPFFPRVSIEKKKVNVSVQGNRQICGSCLQKHIKHFLNFTC